MSINYGKQFEQRFKEDFIKSFSECSVDRLYDSVSGMYGVKNICDYICYAYPNIFYIECKSHKGASIPFENITQYDKLVTKIGIKGVRTGVILWLIDKEIIFYIPIATIKQMKAEGKKSVGLKAYNDGYNIKLIPTKKKRVFLEADYSILSELLEGE